MSTSFYHDDSYALLFCPPVGASGVEGLETAEPSQDEVSASQAVAVYRRVVESSDGLDEGLGGFVSDKLNELSIDELRRLAAELQVPDRVKITEKSALVAEI